MASIPVVGFDPSLRNWGMSKGSLDLESGELSIHTIGLTKPEIITDKQTRKNSADIDRAYQLTRGAWEFCNDAKAIFVEVPVGSQSARSMASYGICVGILGALRFGDLPLYELTPNDIKLNSVGNKTASKSDMIRWAMDLYPNLEWPLKVKNGVTSVVESKAEHMADSIAAIHAGIELPHFKQMLALLKAA